MISRETERFVDEIHDHKEELRSSSELLTALQKSEGKEPGIEEGGSNLTKETCAPRGNKETCANPLSTPTSDSFFSKRLSFQQVKGNGLSLKPTLHKEDIYLHRYPRWSQR